MFEQTHEIVETEVGLELLFSFLCNNDLTKSQQSLFIGKSSLTIDMIQSESAEYTCSHLESEDGMHLSGKQKYQINRIPTRAILIYEMPIDL